MYKKKRMSPLFILFSILELSYHYILLFIFFLTIYRTNIKFTLFSIAILILLSIIERFLYWFNFKYYIKDDEFRIEHGIFIKKRIYISKGRIQSIDLTKSLWHRLFSMVKVEVNTASTREDSVTVIEVVSEEIGHQLQKELQLANENRVNDAQLENGDTKTKLPKYKISNRRLFIFGLTSGGVGFIMAIGIAFLTQLIGMIPDSFLENAIAYLIHLGILGGLIIVIFVLLFAWVVSVVITLIRYGNFTIYTKENKLHISYGLIEKKQITIPYERIQSIGFKQNLICEPLGYLTIYADIAGGRVQEREFGASTVLFPLLKEKEIRLFLQDLLPSHKKLIEADLKRLPNRGWKSYVFRATVFFLPLIILSLIFLPIYSWIIILLTVLSGLIGLLRLKTAGFHINEETIVLQHRFFSKERLIVYKHRIQAIEKKQNPLQKRSRLATFKLTNISGRLGRATKIRQVEEKDINFIADWLQNKPE